MRLLIGPCLINLIAFYVFAKFDYLKGIVGKKLRFGMVEPLAAVGDCYY